MRELDDVRIRVVPQAEVAPEGRTIVVDGDPVTLALNSDVPWLTGRGVDLVRVYQFGQDTEDGTIWFGVGNEVPPALGWAAPDDFYSEWPQ